MLLLIFLLITSRLFSQEYNFIKYDAKNGLELSQTSDLELLDDGRLVVATFGGGISIYDGQKFKVLNTANGLCNDNIFVVEKCNNDVLFLGTDKGLIQLRNNKPTNFFVKDGLPSNTIYSLEKDSQNVLWIGTDNGLAKYKNGKIEKIENDLFNNRIIWSFFNYDRNTLWIAINNGIVFLNKNTNKITCSKNFTKVKRAHTITKDKNGNIFIGTENGLFKIINNKPVKVFVNNNKRNNKIWSIHFDEKNNMWLGTEKGIVLFNGGKRITIGSKQGLVDYRIWKIKNDFENNIWIASDRGLFKLTDESFKLYRKANGKQLDAWSILELEKNKYWISTELNGIIEYKNNKFTNLNILSFTGPSTMFRDKKNNIWIGNRNGIYKSSYPNYKKPKLIYNKNTEAITNINQDKNGKLYFSTIQDGIITFNGRIFKQEKRDFIINKIFFDSRNNTWVATSEGLKQKINDSLFVPEKLKRTKQNMIITLLEDNKNYIWFGTYEKGLLCFNTKDPDFAIDTVSVDDGLNNNSVLGLTIDKDQYLWITTNKGINRLDLNEYHKTKRKKILSFDLNDGITGLETYQDGILTDSQNNIFIGTVDGLLLINPETVKENKRPPVTKITDVVILDKNFNEIYVENEELKKAGEKGLELSYNQNNLTIHFVGISLTNPGKVKYSYRINNGQWSQPKKEAKAFLPNLPYGKVKFQVKSCNNNGVWSKVPAEINFEIFAPIWKKLWFQILLVVLFFLGVLMFYLYRLSRINQVTKDLEERVAEKINYEAKLLKTERELIIAKEKAESSEKFKTELLGKIIRELKSSITTNLKVLEKIEEHMEQNNMEKAKDKFTEIKNHAKKIKKIVGTIENTLKNYPENSDNSKDN